MSNFDQLLDFGETTTTSETNGKTQHTGAVDEFDPFGPSPTIESKGAVDGNLLVDFTVDTEVTNGQHENGSSEPYEVSFEVSTSEMSNPLYDMSSDTSGNPLYLSEQSADGEPANPLYEFTTTTETSSSKEHFEVTGDDDEEPSNPLYELSNNGEVQVETTVTTTTTTSSSANPLYDYMENGDQDAEELDKSNEDSGIITMTETEKVAKTDDWVVVENTTVTESQHEISLDDVNTSAATQETEEISFEQDDVIHDTQREIISDDQEELIQVQEREVTQEEPAYEEVDGQQDLIDMSMDSSDAREIITEVTEEVRENIVERSSRSRSRSKSPSVSDKEEHQEEEEVIQDGRVISRSKEEKRYSESSFGGPTEGIFVGVETNTSPPYMGGGHYQENGFDAGPHDPNIAKETQAKEDFHFSEMSSVRRSFEDGSQDASTSHGQHTEDVQWDEDEEGVFENKPVVRSDVARESDRNIGVELPEVGMAKHMLNRFTKLQSEPGEVKKREITPPNTVAGRVEFVSEPTTVTERYEGKAEAGVFENEPAHNPNIVRSGEEIHEELPERGMARNVAEKFKRLESSSGSAAPPSPTKREITPDRATGKVEFVSEPRGHVEKYEGKAEAGVFESTPHSHEGVVKSGEEIEEELPERGYAKNIAAKFKQMGSGPTPTPRGKRDITPDKHTRGEYVSEPRTQVERYEGKAEAGVFENCPNQRPDVIKSDEVISEEPLPERGYTKNIAAKFREWESTAKSPPPTPNRTKEFTPPREDRNLKQSSGVYESHPEEKADVAKETVHLEETLPERGTARNLVSRFRQLEEESSRVQTSSRGVIEITPPRAESGVFENQPNQFTPEYSQKAESGILESQPVHRDDVVKESDPVRYEEELPERGAAKNLVSKWRQIESESAKHSPPSGQRQKEFTPPRDEERVKQARSPRTPVSPSGHAQSVQPEDLPGQYQQSHEPAVFESSPVHRDDCIREADTDWTEGMPKSNTTKKMLAKFKNIQAEAYKEPPKPISRKEEGDRQTPDKETKVCSSSPDHESMPLHFDVPAVHMESVDAKKSGFFVAVQTEKCGACQKTVYAMEKLEMNNTIYHKTCFKCSQCKSRLTPKTFAVNNGVIFCTNHYKQLFARKGNYDEGFGREQYKKKWRSEPNLTESEPEDATT